MKPMASFASVRQNGWRTQAAWTTNNLLNLHFFYNLQAELQLKITSLYNLHNFIAKKSYLQYLCQAQFKLEIAVAIETDLSFLSQTLF